MASNDPSNDILARLAHLRAQLTPEGRRKAREAQLREHLSLFSDAGADIDKADEDLLDLMAEQALQGVDISKSHPTFFRKLLANAALRRAFLETLETMERMQAGIPPASLPSAALSEPPHYQEILNKVPPQPVVDWWHQQRWRVTWRQTAAQLQSIFLPASPSPTYRAEIDPTGDIRYALFRSQVDVEGFLLDITLDAVHPAGADALNLTLAVAQASGMPPLFATLSWGSYRQTQTLTSTSLTFPPLPIDQILDPTQEKIVAPLNLVIETTPPTA